MKSIYLIKRKKDMSHDAFVRRWRQHGALVMSTKFFPRHMTGYVQAEVLQPAPIAGMSAEYDAVAYIVTRDDTLYLDPTPDEIREMERMLDDELETFAGPVGPTVLITEPHILKGSAPGGITAFMFFNRVPDAVQAAERYTDSADRVVLNLVREEIPDRPERMCVYSYRAVVEVSAYELGKLRAVIDRAEGASWRAADVATVTRETVMWEGSP